MKTMLLAVVAAFALTSFAAPVRAEDAPAADGAKAEKKAKKGGKKKDAEKAPAEAPAEKK